MTANPPRLLEAQIERWTTEAKRLAEVGEESRALELYRQAADALPGAPWLQQRTAELARRLKRNDLAIIHFRRAGMAFHHADLSQRAVAPLRIAWRLALQGLPASCKVLVDLAVELMQVLRHQGCADAALVACERTNIALRAGGFSEIPRHLLEPRPRAPLVVGLAQASHSTPRSSSVRPCADRQREVTLP